MLKNSRRLTRLQAELGDEGTAFLEYSLEAIERMLPHLEIDPWTVEGPGPARSSWTSPEKSGLRLSVGVVALPSRPGYAYRLCTTVQRKHPAGVSARRLERLSPLERYVCEHVSGRISSVLGPLSPSSSPESLTAIQNAFDGQVVSAFLRARYKLELDPAKVLLALRRLAEQSYENKPVLFGCLFVPDSERRRAGGLMFSDAFLRRKKYRALSDGLHTAYRISYSGRVMGLMDLRESQSPPLGRRHYFPEWHKQMARASQRSTVGICLTGKGELLVFCRGDLLFTYRNGRWQCWNHRYFVGLLRAHAGGTRSVAGLVRRIYGAALDAAFRRSGGLLVLLDRPSSLRSLVRRGDAIGDRGRHPIDWEFDASLAGRKISSLSPRVLDDLVALDGAVVVDRRGKLLAYGALIEPKAEARTSGEEGSRTKAAMAASWYGMAARISVDGTIEFYKNGSLLLGI